MGGGGKSARIPQRTLVALLAPRRLAYLEKPHADSLSPTQLHLHNYTMGTFFILPTCVD